MAVKPLILSISANVDGVKAGERAMNAALANIEKNGGDLAEEFNRQFKEIAQAPAEAAKAIGSALKSEIRAMEREAEQAVALGKDFNPQSGFSVESAAKMADNYRKMAADQNAVYEATQKVITATAQEKSWNDEVAKSALMARAAYAQKAEAAEQTADYFQKLRDAQGGATNAIVKNNGAMDKATVSAGQMRASAQQLGYQISDVATQFASGTPPMIIFAQQGSQVVQAVAMMKGESSALASFIGGPWGALIMGGVTVLGYLYSAHQKSGEESKANERAHMSLADKLDVTKNSTNAVIEAAREYIAVQEKSRKITLEEAEANEKAAKTNIGKALAIRTVLQAQLDQANANAAYAMNNPSGMGLDGGAAIANANIQVGITSNKLTENEKEIENLKGALQEAYVEVATERAKVDTDPSYAIEQKYKRLTNAAIEAGGTSDVLAKKLAQLNREKMAELDILAKSQRESRNAGRSESKRGDLVDFMMPVQGTYSSTYGRRTAPTKGASTQHNALDIAVPVGTPVYAAQDGWVKKAREVGGYGNRIELNHGAGTLSTYSHLSKMLVEADQQVKKGQLIGYSGGAKGAPGSGTTTGPHLHYEIIVNGKKVDPRKKRFAIDASSIDDAAEKAEDALARKAEQEAKERADAAKQLDQQLYQLDGEALQLKRASITDAEKLAQFDKEMIDRATERAVADYKASDRVTKGYDSALDQQMVEMRMREVANAKKAEIDAKRAAELRGQAIDAEMESLNAHADLLSLDGQLAGTNAQRYQIAKDLLAIEQRLKILAIEKELQAGRITPEEAAARVDAVKATANKQGKILGQQYQGPMTQYRGQLQNAVGDMNEAMEGVQVRGLQSLEDGLTNIIMGTESVGKAFKRMAASILADLIRIQIQKMIMSQLDRSLGSSMGSTGGSGGFMGSAKGAIGLASSFISRKFAQGGLPGFAGGSRSANGMISGPGTGTSDSILALVDGKLPILVSNQEGIVNAEAVRNYWPLIDAMNKGTFPRFAGGGLLERASKLSPAFSSANPVQMSAGGGGGGTFKFIVEASPELHVRIEQVANESIKRAAPAIVDAAANATITEIRRPTL